jgi:hypothetical protein
MAVTVTPDSFTFVEFDAGAIARLTRKLVKAIDLPPKTDVLVEIDERVPLGRAVVASIDPLVLQVEGGALEDPKRPRQLSTESAADVIGRLLFRARDRLDPEFGDAPPDDALSLALTTAWDVHSTGRLVQLGYRSQRQRWLYAFRNRHGFTDAADDAFERLWTAPALTWTDIAGLSDGALAARDVDTRTQARVR